ncbi:hypothetical protein B0E42_25355 [Pseudomonas sp. A25(2017)]|nr:hypothetical protein B0E42_25355 [Pseudomonas sp. A25(2017)]
MGVARSCVLPKSEASVGPCGSGLARESGVTVDIDVGCSAAFASKPAPTLGLRCIHKLNS